jgi:hypothetical protein
MVKPEAMAVLSSLGLIPPGKLPTMSKSDFPEHFPFALDASFLPCAPGSACLKPRKVSEAARFRPILLAFN